MLNGLFRSPFVQFSRVLVGVSRSYFVQVSACVKYIFQTVFCAVFECRMSNVQCLAVLFRVSWLCFVEDLDCVV